MLKSLNQGKRIKVIKREFHNSRGNILEWVANDVALIELDNGFQTTLHKDNFVAKGV